MTDQTDKIHVRYVIVKGSRYLRQEDVARMILEVAATEEVDVRRRLEELVRNLDTSLEEKP